MKKVNEEIKGIARKYGIRLWQISDELHVSEATMTRKLRHELSDADRNKIIDTINRLKDEKKQEA